MSSCKSLRTQMEFDQEGRNSCDQYWCAAPADAVRAISL